MPLVFPLFAKLWPLAFARQLGVRLGGPTLVITWRVTNRGRQARPFQAALHTCLRVADAGQAQIEGLAGAPCCDRWADGRPGVRHPALLGLADGLIRPPESQTGQPPQGNRPAGPTQGVSLVLEARPGVEPG